MKSEHDHEDVAPFVPSELDLENLPSADPLAQLGLPPSALVKLTRRRPRRRVGRMWALLVVLAGVAVAALAFVLSDGDDERSKSYGEIGQTLDEMETVVAAGTPSHTFAATETVTRRASETPVEETARPAASRAPSDTPAMTESPAVTLSPTVTSSPSDTPSSTPTPTSTFTATPLPSATWTATTLPRVEGTIDADAPLNVRAGPGTRYEVVAMLLPLDVIEVVGVFRHGDSTGYNQGAGPLEWYKIELSCGPDARDCVLEGWVGSDYVAISETDPALIPALEAGDFAPLPEEGEQDE